MIYADNAATTMLDPEALDAMMPYLTDQYANPSQPYAFSRPARKAVGEARKTIARIIGAEPDEIIFTSGGTEGDNLAVKGIPDTKRRRIITTAMEHHAVLHAASSMERKGYPVVRLLPEPEGRISPESLKKELDDETALVSVQLVNNETGIIQPVARLAALSHQAGAYFHTDAVQAVGHIPVHVKTLDVDMLSASAHKFHGPKGVGFFFKRKGVSLSQLLDGGAQEKGLRAGTENVAGIVGMAKALEIADRAMSETTERLRGLEALLLQQLSGLDYVLNSGDLHAPGTMSLSFPGCDGEMILHRLDLKGIAIATGSACTSGRTGISHVLEAMGMEERAAKGTIRISLGRFNTKEDVLAIAEALKETSK